MSCAGLCWIRCLEPKVEHMTNMTGGPTWASTAGSLELTDERSWREAHEAMQIHESYSIVAIFIILIPHIYGCVQGIPYTPNQPLEYGKWRLASGFGDTIRQTHHNFRTSQLNEPPSKPQVHMVITMTTSDRHWCWRSVALGVVQP